MAHVKICIKEELKHHMTQLTGNFTVNVKTSTPPPPALVLNPISGAEPDETEGVAVADDLVTNVSGGVPPYTFALGGGLPAGVDLVEKDHGDGTTDVVLEGIPAVGSAAASPYSFSVTVTDSDTGTTGSTLSARRSINVAARR